MKTSTAASSLFLVAACTCWTALAHAETPYERDQREQMEKAQREGKLSPDAQQALRWQQEWRQEHPGEPMPNAGQLQKLHRDETTANIRAGGAKMRAQRQADLQREYQMSRDHQERVNAANHVTWSAAQWQQWSRQYDAAKRQQAEDYKRAAALSGEMARQEHEREEQEKLWKDAH